MPSFVTPEAYVEETLTRRAPIEGVDVATAGFVGPTLKGPAKGTPPALAGFAEFECIYGAPDTLRIDAEEIPNYLAHAVRAFFDEGGRRLYIGRVLHDAGGKPLTEQAYAESGLRMLDGCDDVSVVAAPGATANEEPGRGVMQALVRHVEQRRDRFAVLDTIRNQTARGAEAMRRSLHTSRAALYYPWVEVDEPPGGRQRRLTLPPSGFVSGILARMDRDNGVHKAPANAAILSALGFEHASDPAERDRLNTQGVNVLYDHARRGPVVGGARTLSGESEWKYVNVRRYFLYLEQSIGKGTKWAVFEPNGEPLWTNIRKAVDDFLLHEFIAGRMPGAKPEEAWFVRCGRDTMTQDDIDNGRLVCEVGVAPLRPAEFVIFRIAQKTADA